MLTPKNILMILLLAEVLSPINRLCQFLQTRNLNFCSIDNKIDELYKQLKVQPKVLFIKWIIVRHWHNQRYNWKICDTYQTKICWKFESRNQKCLWNKKLKCYVLLMLSVHSQKQIVQRIFLNKQNIMANPNKIFLKVTQIKFLQLLTNSSV